MAEGLHATLTGDFHSEISQTLALNHPISALHRANRPSVQLLASPGFADWLSQHCLSMMFTTYQSNSLFVVSSPTPGQLAVSHRTFDKPMGLYATPDRLCLSTRYQIWQFENLLDEAELHQGHDRVFVPRIAHTTGDLNVHDVVLDQSGKLVFVNTDFSALATLDQQYSFVPTWRPSFISKLVAEDRCHLNGLALVEGIPAFVTACSTTDTAAGWRDRRLEGGVVIDVQHNRIIAEGLSMPHSPRWYRGKLWLLNSGTGELGYIENPASESQFVPIAFCPGFVRGLSFWENYALVGLSKLRSRGFTGLGLESRLAEQNREPQCGLLVVDLNTGTIVHWLHLEGGVEELFDVAVLPGVRHPKLLGLEQEDLQRLVTFPGSNGLVTTKPTVSRPKKTAPIAGLPTRSATSLPTPQPVRIKFQNVYHLNAENLDPYAAFTFPNLAKRWQTQPQQGELFGVSAAIEGSLVGLAIAELQADLPESQSPPRSAELLSLFVLPECRQQGIGSKLVQHLEASLRQNGAEALRVSYQATALTQAALEPLLHQQGWQPPESTFLLGETTGDRIAEAPWLAGYPLPTNFTVFPWQELTQVEATALRQQSYPESLSPWTNDARIEPLNSLGLRYEGRVIGWMLTHRVAADTIRYSTLYVMPPYQKLGRAVALLALAVKRQLQSNVPSYKFAVAADNTLMQRFVHRRLQPYLSQTTTARQVQKLLS